MATYRIEVRETAMPDIERFQCAACGDRHDAEDRVADGGQRLCPECGHAIAEPVDVEVTSL